MSESRCNSNDVGRHSIHIFSHRHRPERDRPVNSTLWRLAGGLPWTPTFAEDLVCGCQVVGISDDPSMDIFQHVNTDNALKSVFWRAEVSFGTQKCLLERRGVFWDAEVSFGPQKCLFDKKGVIPGHKTLEPSRYRADVLPTRISCLARYNKPTGTTIGIVIRVTTSDNSSRDKPTHANTTPPDHRSGTANACIYRTPTPSKLPHALDATWEPTPVSARPAGPGACPTCPACPACHAGSAEGRPGWC